MVHGQSADLNTLTELFQTLQDWEFQLKNSEIDFDELGL